MQHWLATYFYFDDFIISLTIKTETRFCLASRFLEQLLQNKKTKIITDYNR